MENKSNIVWINMIRDKTSSGIWIELSDGWIQVGFDDGKY